MKALLVNGSPRKAGRTHTALQVVGDALRESGRAAGVEPPARSERRIGVDFIRWQY